MYRPLKKISLSSSTIKPLKIKGCFNKTYTLCKSEKYDQFLDALGVHKSTKINAMLLKSSISLSYDKDEYELTHYYSDGHVQKVHFKLDEQFIRETPGGSKAVSKFELKGNKLKEKLMLGEKEIIIVREFGEKNLIITMAVNRVKCLRQYKVAPSKHSIQTETSRRQSLFKTEVYQSESPPIDSESTANDSYYTSSTKSNQEMCY